MDLKKKNRIMREVKIFGFRKKNQIVGSEKSHTPKKKLTKDNSFNNPVVEEITVMTGECTQN